MKVTAHGNRYQVRVEELLPCPRFLCSCDLMSCAIRVWCPEGCFDTNDYIGVCIPRCIDCVFYSNGECVDWKEFQDRHEHSALSRKI